MDASPILSEPESGRTAESVEAHFRALVDFLLKLSHELRSPLNGILGFAELMHSGKLGRLAPEHREYLGDILSSARQLHLLINQVLERASAEADYLEPAREPFSR